MRYLLVIAALLAPATALAQTVAQGDAAAGKRAYDEAKCGACHDKLMGGDGNRIFTRADRRITSAPALSKMIRFCIDRTGASVFPEDVDHIAAYLNANFYKFK